ncbi:phosphoglycerate mutase family protein [Bacillus cytotoxicus]|uniref:Phosphoglycerate mutase family protein n=1 Tax=Bacillus cytotoxicus TaxID=580165 RepID=A0ACC6ABQ2_9BACI|nr:phosphoglycerate mutase family protein [Bacillus cytotoxicus]
MSVMGKGSNTLDENKENIVTLYITRHGKTMLNASERVQGWADSPLVEIGVEVAKNLGNGLKDIQFVNAYSSDSGRAIETANLVLKCNEPSTLNLEQRKDLRELNFGIFEGDKNENMQKMIGVVAGVKSADELMRFSIEEIVNCIAMADDTNQAEDWKTFSTRIKRELDKISEETTQNGGGNVLVVSHGITITALVAMIDSSKIILGLENASVTKILYKNGEYTIESVGDMSYVEKGKESAKV